MLHTIQQILWEIFHLTNEMSPFLLFGFFFAGILHVFLNEETVAKWMGKNNFLSVINASILGIPLPLCSCGVLPSALSLRKKGASTSAIFSFLISTPTTGIDSILATYALMGGFFTGFRVLATFLAAIFVGAVMLVFKDREPYHKIKIKEGVCCSHCHLEHEKDLKYKMTLVSKIKNIFTYGFGDLIQDTGSSIILGVIAGGLISYFIPAAIVEQYLGNVWVSMLVMMAIGIPMYVCATGSIPIAAALMMKGLNPGAAFVFLITGPATNAISLAVINKEFGIKKTIMFLASLCIAAFLLGLGFDYVWKYANIDMGHIMHDHSQHMFPEIVKICSTIFLVLCIIWNCFLPHRKRKIHG